MTGGAIPPAIPPPEVMFEPVKMTPHAGQRTCGDVGVVVVPSDALHFPHDHV